jgi:hypothetical protein
MLDLYPLLERDAHSGVDSGLGDLNGDRGRATDL